MMRPRGGFTSYVGYGALTLILMYVLFLYNATKNGLNSCEIKESKLKDDKKELLSHLSVAQEYNKRVKQSGIETKESLDKCNAARKEIEKERTTCLQESNNVKIQLRNKENELSTSEKDATDLRAKLQEKTEDCDRIEKRSVQEFEQLKQQKQQMETTLQDDLAKKTTELQQLKVELSKLRQQQQQQAAVQQPAVQQAAVQQPVLGQQPAVVQSNHLPAQQQNIVPQQQGQQQVFNVQQAGGQPQVNRQPVGQPQLPVGQPQQPVGQPQQPAQQGLRQPQPPGGIGQNVGNMQQNPSNNNIPLVNAVADNQLPALPVAGKSVEHNVAAAKDVNAAVNSRQENQGRGVGVFDEPTKGTQLLDKIIKRSMNGAQGTGKGKSNEQVADKPVVGGDNNDIQDVDHIPGRYGDKNGDAVQGDDVDNIIHQPLGLKPVQGDLQQQENVQDKKESEEDDLP